MIAAAAVGRPTRQAVVVFLADTEYLFNFGRVANIRIVYLLWV